MDESKKLQAELREASKLLTEMRDLLKRAEGVVRQQSEEEAGEKRRRLWIRVMTIIAFAGVAVLWWLSWPVAPLDPEKIEHIGQRGDAFGAINALFSGLAFAGVIVAIFLQREELRLQRKELSETRAELKRQADAAEKQGASIEQQRRAQLLAAGITAQSAFMRDVFDRKSAGFGNPQWYEPQRAHAAASERLDSLLEQVLVDLGLVTPPPASDPAAPSDPPPSAT